MPAMLLLLIQRFKKCAQDARQMGPLWRGGQVEESPQGRRGVAFSLGTVLLAKQEKVPRAKRETASH